MDMLILESTWKCKGPQVAKTSLKSLQRTLTSQLKKKKKDWHPNRKMGRSFDQVLQKKNIQMTIKQGKKGYYS